MCFLSVLRFVARCMVICRQSGCEFCYRVLCLRHMSHYITRQPPHTRLSHTLVTAVSDSGSHKLTQCQTHDARRAGAEPDAQYSITYHTTHNTKVETHSTRPAVATNRLRPPATPQPTRYYVHPHHSFSTSTLGPLCAYTSIVHHVGGDGHAKLPIDAQPLYHLSAT